MKQFAGKKTLDDCCQGLEEITGSTLMIPFSGRTRRKPATIYFMDQRNQNHNTT